MLEKQADTNVKNDFLSGAIETRIMSEAFKVLSFLEDTNYKLELTNKDDESGNVRGFIRAFVPEKKNPNANITLVIPVMVINYKLKPIDTIIINNSAFPATDSMIKELLLEPETFRKVTMKELKETRILSKIADDYSEQLIDDLEKRVEEKQEKGDVKGLEIDARYLNVIRKYRGHKKEASNYSEPILDCIVKNAPNSNFNVYYVKIAEDNNIQKFDFSVEKIDGKGVRVLAESLGYKADKIAEELTSKKEVSLKSPVTGQVRSDSVPYDPATVKKTKLFSSVKSGPAKILSANGKELEGVVYDLFNMDSFAANNIPKGRIFVDYDNNYAISSEFQGIPTESDKLMSEDKPDVNETGIFLDPEKKMAFGPIKTLNMFTEPGEPELITANINGKKVKIQKTKELKKYVTDGNKVLIPEYYQWVSLKKRISLYESNPNEYINSKLAENSYTIQKRADGIVKLTRFIGDRINDVSRPIEIPSEQHLKLLFEKIGMVFDNEKLADDIRRNKPVTFFTTFPLLSMLTGEKISNDAEEDEEFSDSKKKEASDFIDNHSKPLLKVFEGLFEASKDQKFGKDLDDLTKVGATNETLDTLFSLGIVNDVNSAVFLTNIDRLKFTLSFLAALRIYIRTGWNVGIQESDVSTAIDSLSEIVSGLELIKAQKLLDKQLAMQNI